MGIRRNIDKSLTKNLKIADLCLVGDILTPEQTPEASEMIGRVLALLEPYLHLL